MSTAEVIAAVSAVLQHANTGVTPHEQATAIRAWWLKTTSPDGRPPCPFAVLSLALPDNVFTLAFQAHFDAATTTAEPTTTTADSDRHGAP